MRAIQVLMEEESLRELDREARREKVDRSKLIRAAVDKLLKELREKELVEQHRRGYEKHPQKPDEIVPWLRIQAWPEE